MRSTGRVYEHQHRQIEVAKSPATAVRHAFNERIAIPELF